MPNAYLSRASLAQELEIAESTVDEMVRRGVLPKPTKLSPGCVRWQWKAVENALASLGATDSPGTTDDAKEAVKRAIEATKVRGRSRAA